MKTLILLLLFCGALHAQDNFFLDIREQNNMLELAKVESYVTGAMILLTFPAVNEMDIYLNNKYYKHGNATLYRNQRAVFALSCIATSTITYFLIKKIRTSYKHKKTKKS
jgi:hypothetical protein